MLQKSYLVNRNLFKLLFCTTALLLCALVQSRATESIALSWQPNGSGVAGFYIYYGTSSHNYSNIQTVGNTNEVVISNLTFGSTYYFAAQAYDASGNKSALSDEATFTAGSATLTPVNIGGHQMTFTLQGTPGKQYIMQYTTNLVNWVSFYTNTAPFQYTTTPDPSIAHQYFRSFRLQ